MVLDRGFLLQEEWADLELRCPSIKGKNQLFAKILQEKEMKIGNQKKGDNRRKRDRKKQKRWTNQLSHDLGFVSFRVQ